MIQRRLNRVKKSRDTLVLKPSANFVDTPHVKEITNRALAYLRSGYAVHFSGPAGTGKTTLSLHIAALLRRPVSLIHGDDDFNSSNLIGQDAGYRRETTVDNYIHSVHKINEETKSYWVANRLTTACTHGHTLIYDEFNRSKPEANTPLLSVLSERILNLPKLRDSGIGYLNVHPNFSAIFTSNPEEYAGVHKTQDALMDRMITIALEHYDRETEIKITQAHSGIPNEDATVIVDIIRELRTVGVNNHRPTIRASVAIAKVLRNQGARASIKDNWFLWACEDILSSDTAKVKCNGESMMTKFISKAVKKYALLTSE